MSRRLGKFIAVLTAALLVHAETPMQQPAPDQPVAARTLYVTVGKSLVVDSPVVIQRISLANGEIAEALATSPRELLVNGKAPGETSLIVWQENGNRLLFDLIIQASTTRLDAINRQLHQEIGSNEANIVLEDGIPFLRGTVNDLGAADRAVMIANALGRPINLLRVKVPDTEAQILIKVRFADVDRSYSQQLGMNLFSAGALNTPGAITTQQFNPPQPQVNSSGGVTNTTFTLTDALNIFFFRPDLNVGATIRALQARSVLQILAEPNVLTINNRPASFLAGGEFPFPTLQGGGGGLGAVTIQFREFGVRINFLPTVTPRGTIRLQVTPEVSALDYSNGLVFQGFTIPGLSTRRVQTEIELDAGQSFVIGGLLDNRLTEQLNRIPGLGDIPFFGKLFRSRNLQKNNSELLVIVTPEIVRPIPAGQQLPALNYPKEFLPPNTTSTPLRTPGIEITGPVPPRAVPPPMPVEQLQQLQRAPQGGQGGAQQNAPMLQFVPVLTPPTTAPVPPAAQPGAPTAAPAAPVKPPTSPPSGASQ